ncbi:MAG: GatB/YqeY domain-containing protein [Candidatus Absconditabacteria bacterium]|nr:GatB/YqeY domain-containing protein [Candidatus Absconditabacteria bacterium]
MTLITQITEDRKQAMRDKNELKKTILNYVLAQIKYKKIELQKDPEDADIIQIIKKEVKALSESIGFLEKAEKIQELQDEKDKKSILESYLPATMPREQTEEIIKKTITELGITDIKTGRGLLMKELMAKYKGEIDGSLVNEIINTL